MSGGDYAYKGDEERCPKMTARIKAVLSKKEKLNPQRVFQARGEKKKKRKYIRATAFGFNSFQGQAKREKGTTKRGKQQKKQKKKSVCAVLTNP